MTRVVVIGLDGATWSLINPMLEKGFLPNLEYVVRNGVSAQLNSTIPPLTATAWASFATGKVPAKTGVFDFVLPGPSIDKFRTVTSREIKGKVLHEILEEQGYTSVLVNLPFSLPPKTRRCIILPSFLESATKIPEKEQLSKVVPELNQYRTFPDLSLDVETDKKEYVEDIRRVEETRFNCAQKLFKVIDWQFFFLLFSGTDWIQHRYFEKMYNFKLRPGHPAMQLFKDIDGYVGWFVKNLPQDCKLMIISDHGFKVWKRVFYINEFLKRNGWLQVNRISEKPRAYLKHSQIRKSIEASRLKTIHLPSSLYKLVTNRVFEGIKRKISKSMLIRFDIANQPSPSSSLAFAPTPNSIFINRADYYAKSRVAESVYDRVLHEIESKLSNLKDPKTKNRVIQHIIKTRKVITPHHLNAKLSDLIIYSETHLVRHELSGKMFESRIVNNHSLEGIFIAYGSDIRKGIGIDSVNIWDIAPTALHMLGCEIPKDMDGKVINEIFLS